MRQRIVFAFCGLLLGLTLAVSAASPSSESKSGKVRAEMKGVDLRVEPSIVMEVRRLHGALVPTQQGKPPWFDDPSSFTVEIDEGEIAVTPASLSALMNEHVFNYPGAPIKDVKIEIVNGRIRQEATLARKIPIRATLEGDLSVTPEGKIRLHPTSVKAGKLPVKGLLDLFGVELDELIKTRESRGVSVVKDDLFLDPEKLLPSPKLQGKVTAVRLERDRIVQVFGSGKGESLHPPVKAAHYMFFRGSELSFGKLTMHGAELQIIDKDPKDPFHFFLPQYLKQLVAGTSHTLPDKGLVVYMPDFDQAGNEKKTR
jgi:hypothetical protein